MRFVFVALIYTSIAIASDFELNSTPARGKIAGGVPVPRDYTYVVAIRLDSNKIGAGVIISKTHILTVAQLLLPMNGNLHNIKFRYDVWVRPFAGQVYDKAHLIQEIYIHPKYQRRATSNDIGIILINPGWTSPFVPLAPLSVYSMVPKRHANLLGFGTIKSLHKLRGRLTRTGPLEKVRVDYISNDRCSKILAWRYRLLSGHHICIQFRNNMTIRVEKNDIGTPLLVEGIVVGLLTFYSNETSELRKTVVFTSLYDKMQDISEGQQYL